MQDIFLDPGIAVLNHGAVAGVRAAAELKRQAGEAVEVGGQVLEDGGAVPEDGVAGEAGRFLLQDEGGVVGGVARGVEGADGGVGGVEGLGGG